VPATILFIILYGVLYGREIRSPSLREEHELREYENKALRRIFGSKREEVMGGWGKLHSEELHNTVHQKIRRKCVQKFGRKN
jgi:hypothetical protein